MPKSQPRVVSRRINKRYRNECLRYEAVVEKIIDVAIEHSSDLLSPSHPNDMMLSSLMITLTFLIVNYNRRQHFSHFS